MTDDWMRWLLSGGMALITAWIGILHRRIDVEAKTAAAATERGNGELRAALDAHKAEYQVFRGNVLERTVTKEDLQRTEERILAALQFAGGKRP